MSIQKVLASELDVREYVAQLGLNPDNVFYQSVSARNISTSNAQWTITSPNKRSYLLSWAVVNWQPTIQHQDAAGAAENWLNTINYISAKPCLPFTNAMSSVTLSVNGNTITLSQPRRFMEGLTTACVNKEEASRCFETGYPDSMGGLWSIANPGKESLATVDNGFLHNEQNFQEKLLAAASSDNYGAFNNTACTGNNGWQEPLCVPPLNPFAKLKSGMPSYMWFSKMSDVIPNIDRLELDIQFQNLTPSVFYPRYMQAVAPSNNEVKRLSITALAADLKLYWYEVPVNTSIPRSVDLQTWNVREYITNTNDTADGVGFNTITSDLIQLNSTPTLIMIHVEVNKDSANYLARAASRSDNFGDNANPPVVANADVSNGGNTSWDAFAEISSLEILLGDRPNVISTNFTQRELYALTQKNSKTPYPYSFEDWRGVSRPTMNTMGNQLPGTAYTLYGSKSVILLRPKDIAEKISDGVFAPNSFQVNVNATARDSTHGIGNDANRVYTMYVHLFFGKHFLSLEPDKAQFQEQSIPLDTARRLTNPVLESQGVSGLGSPLEGLRLRDEGGAFPNIQSRV